MDLISEELAIPAGDFEACLHFYQHVFDTRLARRTSHSALLVQGSRYLLLERRCAEFEALTKPTVYCDCDNLYLAADYLTQLGIGVLWHDTPWNTLMSTRDPANHVILFREKTPRVQTAVCALAATG